MFHIDQTLGANLTDTYMRLRITKLLMCTIISYFNEPSKKVVAYYTMRVEIFVFCVYNCNLTIKYSRKNQSWFSNINFTNNFFSDYIFFEKHI